MRSQGKRRKSDFITACTCGMRSSSAVGVVWSRVAGASISGDGDGSDVKYGFCARAADRASFEVGGVTRVMSKKLGQQDISRLHAHRKGL